MIWVYLAIGCVLTFTLHRALRQAANTPLHQPRRSSRTMSAAEAAAILGLPSSASHAEIKKAHGELMQKLHPDHGGNDYLASQLNAAKEVLLNAQQESSE